MRCLTMLGFALALIQIPVPAQNTDPFAFFQPSVTVPRDDRERLSRGVPVAHTVPSEGSHVAVFAAVKVDADGDRLIAWMRRIEQLKRSSYVQAIGRFSEPPRMEDLDTLALDDEELADVVKCRPGDCSLKLSAGEIIRLRQLAAAAGADWKPRLQAAFRALVLDRVNGYLADGQAALQAYADHEKPISPASKFASLLEESRFLGRQVPQLTAYLEGYPRLSIPDVESFVYWSKERLAGQPIVSATHVNIMRGRAADLPDALVVGRQIFASHYVNASLAVTVLVRTASNGEPGAATYLVYLNRSDVDILGGAFGGVVRWFMQRRLKAEAAEVLDGLRRRLESGEPPRATHASGRAARE